MRSLLCLLVMFLPICSDARREKGIEAIVRFCGVSDVESLDSDEVERLSDYLEKPLKVNMSSLTELQKSGLFTPFQSVAILDYRTRHGDILSFTELAAVDGFGLDAADALEPFVTLESRGIAAGADKKAVRQDVILKGGGRMNDGYGAMYGIKYRMDSRRMLLAVAGSRSYDAHSPYPEHYSGNLVWKHGRGMVVAGDFNARFGQGLALWNTAVIGGMTSPSSFMRKPSGLSPSFSFTGSSSLTGVAVDLCLGKWKTTAVMAMPGIKSVAQKPDNVMLMPALNVSRYGRAGSVSLTHVTTFSDCFKRYEMYRIPQMMTALDLAICVRGVNVFGELAYDWVNASAAGVCGFDMMPVEDVRLATLLKYYPASGFANEYGLAASCEVRRKWTGTFAAEASYFPKSKSKDVETCVQSKLHADFSFEITEYVQMKLRVTERIRTWGEMFRTDVRLDASYRSANVAASARVNVLRCVETGVLGYAEGGYIGGAVSAYFRVGLFRIDNWNDRIYVYERDAPGNFNVPAYYGRGVWMACTMSWKVRPWWKMYLRCSNTGYVFMPEEKRKPGKAELKIQFVFRL